MNQAQFIEHIENTYSNGVALIRKKNADYAGDHNPFQNFCDSAHQVRVSPEKAILLRMADKFSRIVNCIDKGEVSVKEESVTDTLTDLINYTAILKAFLDSKQYRGEP